MANPSKDVSSSDLVSSHYVGRFAPSPSGPLHFGSLVTALGSYLQAKSNDGKWLLRIEDIDPPREVAGASDAILKCLEAHHLFWDDTVVYQSQRSELYLEKLHWLANHDFTYFCQCTRNQLSSQLSKVGNKQLCTCVDKELSPDNCAIRFKHAQPIAGFQDKLLGQVTFDTHMLPAQFALKRKDGLFAYQLAVVVDDIEQGITEVARGADLLSASAFQLALYQAFKYKAPNFLHFPVVVSTSGKKLSKQNHAPAINNSIAQTNLIQGLKFLGLSPPDYLVQESAEHILQWATQEWDLSKLLAEQERIDNRIE